MHTVVQKLNDVDSRLTRWQSRLIRASNEVVKLSKARRRYQAQLATPAMPAVAEVPKEPTEEPPAPPADILELPVELKAPSTDVAKLRDERKAREAPDRRKMPVTGKAAMALLKKKK